MKTSYEPKFLQEASSMLAKSMCLADLRSWQPLKSICFPSKHYKMIENLLKPTKLHLSKFFQNYNAVLCQTPSKQTSGYCNVFASIFAAVRCCKLENLCWDFKRLRDFSPAKRTSSFVYIVLNTKWARALFIARIRTFSRGVYLICAPRRGGKMYAQWK